MASGQNHRSSYRVVYPIAERATIDVGGRIYEVVDVSERGLRYDTRHGKLPEIGTTVSGVLELHGGDSLDVTGDVLRTFDGNVVLVLKAPGVPFRSIVAEQRYLRNKGFGTTD